MKWINHLQKSLLVSVLVITGAVNTCAATTTVTKSDLTLEQAVSRAITSCDVKEVYGSYLEAYEELNKYNQDLFSPVYRNQVLQEKTYQFKMEHINEKVAYDTTDTYLTVVLLNKQIDLLNEQIELQEKLLKQTELKKEKGLASEIEYKTAEDKITTTKASVTQAEKSLDNAILAFKNLTNMDITQYELEDEFELIEPVFEGAFTSYIDKSLEDYYELLQEGVRIGDLKNENMFDMTMGEYYLQEASSFENQYNVDDTKEKLSTQFITYYNSLESTKASVASMEVQIKASEENLRIQEVKYANGLISKMEYETALVEAKSLELKKYEAIYNYLRTKMTIENPNILVM